MQQAFAPDAVTFWGKCSKHFIRELACRNGKARLSVSLRRELSGMKRRAFVRDLSERVIL
ncbi:hypothetical protein M084_0109 [Bacteroides fragilis str. 3988 T1]|nr:hypothetical protein M084_0109 [Bacteroides fragilis str. 3988 T1]EXZ26052.1 hypothetical protein M086_0119 [Bacteroides fragilis str. S13 L11]